MLDYKQTMALNAKMKQQLWKPNKKKRYDGSERQTRNEQRL